ncbi:hypothetical protein Dimus_033204 [Dionaea muscipula]
MPEENSLLVRRSHYESMTVSGVLAFLFGDLRGYLHSLADSQHQQEEEEEEEEATRAPEGEVILLGWRSDWEPTPVSEDGKTVVVCSLAASTPLCRLTVHKRAPFELPPKRKYKRGKRTEPIEVVELSSFDKDATMKDEHVVPIREPVMSEDEPLTSKAVMDEDDLLIPKAATLQHRLDFSLKSNF